jgi:hypothetical protein
MARETVIQTHEEYSLHPVGHIRSTLRAPDEAPRQGSEGAPDAWLDVNPTFARGLFGIAPGDEVIVVTWLHRADRDVLQVHPRGDPAIPLAGVFLTRSRPSMARRSSTSSRFSSTAPRRSVPKPSRSPNPGRNSSRFTVLSPADTQSLWAAREVLEPIAVSQPISFRPLLRPRPSGWTAGPPGERPTSTDGGAL